jgi:sulfur-oxidizing protein SoxZ
MSNIRLKAKLKDGITEVKALIKHPMETGARKELETGKLIPAHFIEEVTCAHNGHIVMSALWSGGISQNPYCAFTFKGGAEGDKVTLIWKDNKGDINHQETRIKEIKIKNVTEK